MVRLKNITRSTLVFASGRVLKPEEELQLKTISAELTYGLRQGWVVEVSSDPPTDPPSPKIGYGVIKNFGVTKQENAKARPTAIFALYPIVNIGLTLHPLAINPPKSGP